MGLMPSVIGFDKFRTSYQRDLRRNIDPGRKMLESELLRCGIFAEGRIRPTPNEAQHKLPDVICSVIRDTLYSGAARVYDSCVFTHWRDRLAWDLRKYGKDTLKDILQKQLLPVRSEKGM